MAIESQNMLHAQDYKRNLHFKILLHNFFFTFRLHYDQKLSFVGGRTAGQKTVVPEFNVKQMIFCRELKSVAFLPCQHEVLVNYRENCDSILLAMLLKLAPNMAYERDVKIKKLKMIIYEVFQEVPGGRSMDLGRMQNKNIKIGVHSRVCKHFLQCNCSAKG